ncbi:MAG: hypothetical protein IPM50_12390 [Acidobacteriota bacterium]|nr:MAG: hypothetical protein IPM50_12390 [Acidobacteriota bacterium]
MSTPITKNSVQAAAALGLLILMTLGCGGLAERFNDAANSVASKENVDRPATLPDGPSSPGDKAADARVYESPENITDFVRQLTEAVGTDNPNILKIAIYDAHASAQVQDPSKPENIDSYTYRNGKLSEPTPVKIYGGGKISDNVFPLKEVNLDGVPALNQEMVTKLAEVEGGKMIGYTVERGLPFSKDIRITPLSDSTRKQIIAQADKNAKLTKFEVQ